MPGTVSWERGMTRKRYEKKFGDDKNILYLDYDGGNKTKHTSKNSLNSITGKYEFYSVNYMSIKLIFQKTVWIHQKQLPFNTCLNFYLIIFGALG